MIPKPTGLYGPFSFDVLSKKLHEVFQNDSPRKWSQTRPFYMALSHLTCCPKQYLKFSKLLAQEMIPNPTSLYGSSHLMCCPKKYHKFLKMSRPRNEPKPDRFVWPFLIWRVVQNSTYYFKMIRPGNDPKPDRFTWQFPHLTNCPQST